MSSISVKQAGVLLNFAGRPGAKGVSAALLDHQLEGAVAAHNLMEIAPARAAYIADAVGMGKTLVASGALALLRHREPGARALVIAPRKHLQEKWAAELRLFARDNIRYSDLRVRGIDGEPVRPVVVVHDLVDLISTWRRQPDADVIARLPSFGLTIREDQSAFVERWRPVLGGASEGPVARALARAGRCSADEAKLLVAACINRLLPDIGVLVFDEAHNLKGGAGPHSAARSRVLQTVFGYGGPDVPGLERTPRVRRLLLLSATPVEDDPQQLARELEVFGRSAPEGLGDAAQAQGAMGTLLFRRVRRLRVGDEDLTSREYRREWRAGGFTAPEEPLRLTDPRGELSFALVQRRVHDALSRRAAADRSFQVGMLTSFETLAQSTDTARRTETEGDFDDEEQNRLAAEDERRGVDTDAVRALVVSHSERFGRPPVHPKLDALVGRLVDGMLTGRKALVFTRRVASIEECLREVHYRYDRELAASLQKAVPQIPLKPLFDRYADQPRKLAQMAKPGAIVEQAALDAVNEALEADEPSSEDLTGHPSRNLFTWLLGSDAGPGWLTPGRLASRFESSGAYETFFDDNAVAAVLGCPPAKVLSRLGEALPGVDVAEEVNARAQRHLSLAQTTAGERFRAAQAAGLDLLSDHGTGDEQRKADAARTATALRPAPVQRSRPVSVIEDLARETFPSQLREHPELCRAIWHEQLPWCWDDDQDFLVRRRRLAILNSALRFDLPALDLWLAEVRQVRHVSVPDGTWATHQRGLAKALCKALLRQQAAGGWSGFEVLRRLAFDSDVVAEVNGVVDSTTLDEAIWRRRRMPAVGMSGGRVQRTEIARFRTPGLPLVLVATEVLQEGADCHTFCDEVHHYGIAWMPSALEQRTGRIDRVNSLTERRLTATQVSGAAPPDGRLNVLYPFVQGTYEQLQVKRVLHRLDEHVQLMQAGRADLPSGANRLNVDEELVNSPVTLAAPAPAVDPYPVRQEWLLSDSKFPLVDPAPAQALLDAFERLKDCDALAAVGIVTWQRPRARGRLTGEALLSNGRYQPVDLQLTTADGWPAVRVVSPVGALHAALWGSLCSGAVEALPVDVRLAVTVRGRPTRRTYELTAQTVVSVHGKDLAARLAAPLARVLQAADQLASIFRV